MLSSLSFFKKVSPICAYFSSKEFELLVFHVCERWYIETIQKAKVGGQKIKCVRKPSRGEEPSSNNFFYEATHVR